MTKSRRPAKQSGVKQKIPIANPHMVAADFDRAIRLAPGEPSVYRAFIGSVPAGESDEEFAAAVEAHPSTPQSS